MQKKTTCRICDYSMTNNRKFIIFIGFIFASKSNIMGTKFSVNEKLQKSRELLSQTEYQISEIAYEVGFNDPKYFSRCFKNKFGQTPREFRLIEMEANRLQVLTNSFVSKIDTIISKNLDNLNFNLELFANTVCMSKQNLYHKMRLHTGMSPLRYIRNKKIEHARNLLRSQIEVQEVMAKVGFYDDKYFIKCFRQETGYTPLKFQKSFNQRIA